MKHRTEIFENCTLLQACEWIAYKIPPMEQIRARALGFKRGLLLPDESAGILYDIAAKVRPFVTEYDKEYSKQIHVAEAKLKLAMYDAVITVYGDISIHETAQQLLDTATGKVAPLGAKPFPEPKFVQITDIPNAMEMDISDGTLKVRGITYQHVYIPFKDLKRAFHCADTVFNTIETRYSTPYMEIMVEVINELKLTPTNQPQKKILQSAIIQKMAERGLVDASGKPSVTLAGYIATIIRLPESQKGHALTAPDSQNA